jgi:hypothetical protein
MSLLLADNVGWVEGVQASGIVTSSASEPPRETSRHNQNTGVDKRSKYVHLVVDFKKYK